MFPLGVYNKLREVLEDTTITEIERELKAQQIYIEFGTEENARESFEVALKENHQDVIEFLKGTKKYSEGTPIPLQNINFQRMWDRTQGLDSEGVRRYEPPKKKVIDLTKHRAKGRIKE